VACGSASKLPMVELRGCELTEDYLVENGFRRPIIVRCKDGLDLRVPHEQFSIADVRDHVGMFCYIYRNFFPGGDWFNVLQNDMKCVVNKILMLKS